MGSNLTNKIIIAVLLAFSLGLAVMYLWQNHFGPGFLQSLPWGKINCTLELKTCPDGSMVGRVPPDCKFTPCPDMKLDMLEETMNWKIYINESYGLEFKYPQDWKVGDSEEGMSSSVLQQPQKNYFLEMNIISPEQLNLMGVTYCAAYPENKPRCESKTYKNIHAIIDWGADNEEKNYASVEITNPNGGMVILDLSPVNSETKSLLYQILSTFKFTE